MRQSRRWVNHEDDYAGANRQTASLAALALTLLLVLIGLTLVHALRNKSRLEDCLISGRTNCVVVVTPS